MAVLGSALHSGEAEGKRRGMDRGVKLMRGASDLVYPDAQAFLGFLYASGIAGTALREDIRAALLMWAFAAEGGLMYAKMALGYRHLLGLEGRKGCKKVA